MEGRWVEEDAAIVLGATVLGASAIEGSVVHSRTTHIRNMKAAAIDHAQVAVFAADWRKFSPEYIGRRFEPYDRRTVLDSAQHRTADKPVALTTSSTAHVDAGLIDDFRQMRAGLEASGGIIFDSDSSAATLAIDSQLQP